MKQEEILVLKREDLGGLKGLDSDSKNCISQGLTTNNLVIIDDLLQKNKAFFKNREEAEVDTSLKQIIPYCIIIQNSKILTYKRGKTSGESRLRSLWSCGIGGHINPIDEVNTSTNQKITTNQEIVDIALLREIQEEFELPWNYDESDIGTKPYTVGIINDNSNSVGEVHLGLVKVLEIPPGPVLPKEDSIEELKFVCPEELLSMKASLESWSQLIATNLEPIKGFLKKNQKNN
jgi:predicted NUDIX family phosphoesterase